MVPRVRLGGRTSPAGKGEFEFLSDPQPLGETVDGRSSYPTHSTPVATGWILPNVTGGAHRTGAHRGRFVRHGRASAVATLKQALLSLNRKSAALVGVSSTLCGRRYRGHLR